MVDNSAIEEWKSNQDKIKIGDYTNFRDISCEYYLDPQKPNCFFAIFDIIDELRYFYLIHFYDHQGIFVFELFKDFGQNCGSMESGAASVISEKIALSFVINKIVEETINENPAKKRLTDILEKAAAQQWKK